MNSQTFELFSTFSDFFTSHASDPKSRYIRRPIPPEEIRPTPPQHGCPREWREQICVQLDQAMNETTSLAEAQQLHGEIAVFETFISHDYFEALEGYPHMEVSSIRQEMRKALNEYLATFLDPEAEEIASCRPSSPLSSDLASAWGSSPPKKVRIQPKDERLALAVKEFQDGDSSARAVAKKYGVCRNTLLNRSRAKRTMSEYAMDCQLLAPDEETAILTFVDSFIELGFPPRLAMLKEKAELILRNRGHNVDLGRHWIDRFLARHSEYRAKFPRHLDQERHFNSDRDVFEKWFELFDKTCLKYSIANGDIYNMDEKGYMMGVSGKVG